MKRIIITIVFAFAVNAVIAQTYNMKIKQGTGTTHSVTSTVDEITFVNTTTTPFVCGDVILYGGETYPTVLIGSQCWFQKNLNIGTRIAGSSNQTSGNGIEKYCYDNLDVICKTFGGLYQWNEAMQYVTTEGAQGICPPGWHIPTYSEFQTLATSVSGNSNSLKVVGQGTDAGIGTNTSGFSGVLAGYRSTSGAIYNLNADFNIWISTEHNVSTSDAYNRKMLYNDNVIYDYYYSKDVGLSVRCIKD